jgi:hypothetical protein
MVSTKIVSNFSDGELLGVSIFLAVMSFAFGTMVQLLIRKRTQNIPSGNSLMTLVSEYRRFLEKTVYRIRNGALGTPEQNNFEVVICIDELDKITDMTKLKSFVTRIKSIFEIPGTYYYLSLSEDALTSFNLGSAFGKTEIDSAFDHVIYIPAMPCKEGEQIAKNYLQKHAFNFGEAENRRIPRCIAVVSFGVSRDIVRICDFCLSEKEQFKGLNIADYQRDKLTRYSHNQNIISEKLFGEINSGKKPGDVAKVLVKYFENEPDLNSETNIARNKLLLSIWLLALVSIAVDSLDDTDWDQYSESLRDIGFRISDESQLTTVLANMHAKHRELVDPKIELKNIS